jgi:hypothetical protein
VEITDGKHPQTGHQASHAAGLAAKRLRKFSNLHSREIFRPIPENEKVRSGVAGGARGAAE